MSPPAVRSLSGVAIDLTPVLPGGDNGGAKIFVLDLVRRLSIALPSTSFVLLTHSRSHDELGALDRANLRRRMVIDERPAPPVSLAGPAPRRSLLHRVAGRLRRSLRIWSPGDQASPAPQETGYAPGMLHAMNVNLLFCPFTAPTYYEPAIPTVCTIYDLQYKTYPEFFTAEDVAHRRRTFVDAAHRASALAAISEFSREAAVTHGGIDPARIRTIHLRMTHRIGERRASDGAVLQQWGLGPGLYLVYPANFWRHKNHEMLLTAFGIACRTGLPANVRLVCTGAPGERQKWLREAARGMDLGDRVVFPGFVSDAALSALISNSAGVVFPSLFEGFGLPVIEAMAAGVPVGCSNTTSLPEVAGDAALLFDPRIPMDIASVIVRLVVDRELAATLIDRGRRRAHAFADSERMCDDYLDLFRFALANEKLESVIDGTYIDGWCGPMLSIQVASATGPQCVELELTIPGWLPAPQVTIRSSIADKNGEHRQILQRGQDTSVLLPVGREGAVCNIAIGPTFVPAECGMGEDRRELSVMLRRCSIVRDNAGRTDLFPQKAAR